jgi:enoyl-[acyl-carrier-protein] reductase (NADH)
MVNPDGIFEGSGLWSKEVRNDRAKSYGISPKQIEKFYQNRNLLKAQVRSEDVASAVVFLASEESARTTGAMIPVDGGLREAFPR